MELIIEKAADLIASGRTSDEIAAALNVTVPVVREWRQRGDVRAYVNRCQAHSDERLHDTVARIVAEMEQRRRAAVCVLAEVAAAPDMKPGVGKQARASLRRSSGRSANSGASRDKMRAER